MTSRYSNKSLPLHSRISMFKDPIPIESLPPNLKHLILGYRLPILYFYHLSSFIPLNDTQPQHLLLHIPFRNV
jgi:hypothetical protein